jgi:hypothetical protein
MTLGPLVGPGSNNNMSGIFSDPVFQETMRNVMRDNKKFQLLDAFQPRTN